MAHDMAAGGAGQQRRRLLARPLGKLWIAMLVVGVAAVVAGVALIVGPLLGVFSRGSADQSALQAWKNGGSAALVGPAHGGSSDVGKTTCGSSSPSDYAVVTFTGLPQYGYAGVAGDGTWDLLNQRSMVHYHGTPNPGQQGNVIIAFHREPDYEHIDQLGVGETITIEDKACHTFVYRITNVWDLPPSQVSQLVPTSGYDLTMITCNPWWQDYDRLVWRASLIAPAPGSGGAGQFTTGGASSQAANPGQPSF
ncbi:MAG: class E sortase [Candidatus Dormibacteraeota bacterium]|nr:class E sortase [Candidatus Dormibacteraeota bacterium]